MQWVSSDTGNSSGAAEQNRFVLITTQCLHKIKSYWSGQHLLHDLPLVEEGEGAVADEHEAAAADVDVQAVSVVEHDLEK